MILVDCSGDGGDGSVLQLWLIVVLTDVSVAVVIWNIFFCLKLCGGRCFVGIGGDVNDGCGDSSLVYHHHKQ